MFKATTIIALKHNGRVAMAGDGQVTLGETIMKGDAHKVTRIYGGKVLVGFAGSTADAFTLREMLEERVNKYNGDIYRAVVDLAKEWRVNKTMAKLEAMLLVADKDQIFLFSGSGDIIAPEPEKEVLAIGSGGMYAYSAALAFKESGAVMTAGEMARKSMEIAAQVCIYTNHHFVVEEFE